MNAVVSPASEEEIRETVLDAISRNTALRITGGGTRATIGHPVEHAQRLDVSGHKGVTLYDPGTMTLVARAGTRLSEIKTMLAAENQMLAFEPMDHRPLLNTKGDPTVGGMVSCNVSGPRRFLSGACRDHLLGVRFVDGRGSIIRNGGRVMKNVTGLDLSKLLCGAYGTLGVLSEVALKVRPRCERAATLRFSGIDATEAVRLFCKALSTPFEVSGAVWQNDTAFLRIEGFATQMTYRLKRLQALFAKWPHVIVNGKAHADLWRRLRDVQIFRGCEDAVWKLSVKATDAPAIVTQLNDSLGSRAALDIGGAVIWLAVPSDKAAQQEAIRASIARYGGHAMLVSAHRSLRDKVSVFQPQSARIAAISIALRRQFDPANIFNPGLMGA